jgi:hypothetical protein
LSLQENQEAKEKDVKKEEPKKEEPKQKTADDGAYPDPQVKAHCCVLLVQTGVAAAMTEFSCGCGGLLWIIVVPKD